MDKYVHLENILIVMGYFCVILQQDAIAFKVNNVGYMAFNSQYKGERFAFNSEYFLNYE